MRLTINEELKQAKVTFKPEETKEAIKVATILRDTENITLGETDRKTYICFSYNMDKAAFKKEYTEAKYMVYDGITPNNKFVSLPGKEFNTLHTDNKTLSCRKDTYATTPLYKLIISNRVVYITKTLSDLNKFVNANWTKLDNMQPMSDHDVAVWIFLANNFEVYINEDGTTEIPMEMARTFGGYTYEYKEEIKKLGKYTFDYVHKEWIDKNFVYPEEFEGFKIKTWEDDQLGRFYSFDVKTETDMATETQTETDMATETQTETDMATETQPEADMATETQLEADMATETQPEADMATETQPETDMTTETQPETDMSTETQPEADMATETQPEADKDQIECHHVVNPCTPQAQNPMQQPQSNTTIELPATAKVFGHGYSTPCKYDLDAHHEQTIVKKICTEIEAELAARPYLLPKYHLTGKTIETKYGECPVVDLTLKQMINCGYAVVGEDHKTQHAILKREYDMYAVKIKFETVNVTNKILQEALKQKNPFKYPEILDNYLMLYMEFGFIDTVEATRFIDLLPSIFCIYTKDDLSEPIYNGHEGDYDFYDLQYFALEFADTLKDCDDKWKIQTNGDIYLGDDLVLQRI